jgi:diaminopimelate epimerase
MSDNMSVLITKMNGIGNDFFIINAYENTAVYDACLPHIQQWCCRKNGLGTTRKGADGIAFLRPSHIADFRMTIHNADGSEPEMCGNVLRCIAKFAYDTFQSSTSLAIETRAGIKTCDVKGSLVSVNMGKPTYFSLKKISFEDTQITLYPVSMGNPHAVVVVDDVASVPVDVLGPYISSDPLFPEGVNVEFIHVVSPTNIVMRVWERGIGETLACGTGACASAVVGHRFLGTEHSVTVTLRGGSLLIDWDTQRECIYMTGATEYDYSTTVPL